MPKTSPTAMPQPRSSRLVRYMALAYLLLIIYASLYPFYGWRDIGLSAWSYLKASLHPYIFKFDLFINLFGYIPFGFLSVLAFYPRLQGKIVVVLVVLLGIGLSANMEALQTFLPSRVASNLDLVCNSLGTFVGALLGRYRAHPLIESGVLFNYRQRWFEQDASGALLLLVLWLLALLYPQFFLLDLGDVLKPILAWVQQRFGYNLDFSPFYPLSMVNYHWFEGLISSLQIAGCCWLLASLLRQQAPRQYILIAWGILTILAKIFSYALLAGAEEALNWITPGIQTGFLIGLGTALLVNFRNRRQRQWAAVTCFTSALILVNLIPKNYYLELAQKSWEPGRFINFSGVTLWLAALWPFAALIYLINQLRKKH